MMGTSCGLEWSHLEWFWAAIYFIPWKFMNIPVRWQWLELLPSGSFSQKKWLGWDTSCGWKWQSPLVFQEFKGHRDDDKAAMVPNKMKGILVREPPFTQIFAKPLHCIICIYISMHSAYIHIFHHIPWFECWYLSIQASKADLLKLCKVVPPESSNHWFSRKRRCMACCWGWTWVFYGIFFGFLDLSYSRLDVDNTFLQGRKQ